ncbi:hypothetical protein [Bradyrhizobium sp. B024]|uniref:DUF1269 domain-containing protein n=1 Tax=Bradyrhizobium diazoefficiens TaxID=1355477 RepID=A0A810BK34_9BRAD|nr:hypothetical protein [Bradyrhizobium japonicum]BCE33580.1 hypothetical protein XF2B_73490 [Bradyrhizobium diazoefficiens]BCE77196.1 hypothetical protein XF8B_73070 [Bradyrhizobium diazoefficiens]BCF20656.1 hypothetical protein XF13B_73470 [Bradyrhizobium diazoefficiens]
MPTTICRLYDAYADANRVILLLEVSGVPLSDTSLISNNCDAWYRGPARPNVVPLRRQRESSDSGTRIESTAIGATAATAGLITILAVLGVGPVVGAGWLATMLSSIAIGGVTGGLLGALTNAGINEVDAQVFVEVVRRGGTLVATRVPQEDVPRIGALMIRGAVNLAERSELYREAGRLAFDPNAPPYAADQVRCERALHAR